MRPARRRGLPLPRASRTRSRWPCICTVASRSRGRPARGVAHPPCGDGFPLPRASRSGRGASAVWRWLPAPEGVPLRAWRIRRVAMGSRSRGRPVHGRVGRASVPWLPAPAGVPLRAWRRPPCGHALPRVRPPAASPVRPYTGVVLRPPHFHHSIWKANDKPAPPNVMISLRFPAAGAVRGAPGAACSTAFAPRGRGFRHAESSAGQPCLLRSARTRFSRRPAERFCAASPPAQKAGRSRPATCSPIPAGRRGLYLFGGAAGPAARASWRVLLALSVGEC